MKTYKEVVTEKFLMESKPLFEFKGVKVFPTNHSVEREVERMDSTSKQVLEYISLKAIGKLAMRTQSAEYLIYSNKYKRGIVVDHRQDKYGTDDKMHLFIITILPKGKKQPKAGTRMVMVENYLAENNLKFDEDHIIIIDDEINESDERKTELVHKDVITAGDTIMYKGKEKTLSSKDIGKDDLLGKTILGDSYKSGKDKVERVLFKKFKQGKFIGWVAQT